MKNPWRPRNPIARKKSTSKTKSSTIKMLLPTPTTVDSLSETTINQSASKTSTASTLDPTVPTDVSNVNVPQKKKGKKNARISTLRTCRNPKCKKDLEEDPGTCRNPKRKKDLEEDPDDSNVRHPQAVESNVPTYVCNWAQVIRCKYPQLEPQKCQHTDCKYLVHHLTVHGKHCRFIVAFLSSISVRCSFCHSLHN
jgi:hypothetical protein